MYIKYVCMYKCSYKLYRFIHTHAHASVHGVCACVCTCIIEIYIYYAPAFKQRKTRDIRKLIGFFSSPRDIQ